MSARVRRQSYRSQTRAEVRFGMLIPRRTDDGKGDPVSDGHEDGARPPGYRLMLREMAADERPREKLKLRGSAALSDGELLAIILNTGIDNVTRTVYVHSYTRRGRRQLRTRGAANADGGSAQAPTLSAFGFVERFPHPSS